MTKEREFGGERKLFTAEERKYVDALIDELFEACIANSMIAAVWGQDKRDIEQAIYRYLRDRDKRIELVDETDKNAIEEYLLQIIFDKFIQEQ